MKKRIWRKIASVALALTIVLQIPNVPYVYGQDIEEEYVQDNVEDMTVPAHEIDSDVETGIETEIASGTDGGFITEGEFDTSVEVPVYAKEYEGAGEISDAGEQINGIVDGNKVSMTYANPRMVLHQYVAKDNTKAKLILGNVIYSYNISTNTFSEEYTFPESTIHSEGRFYSNQSIADAYIDENTGLLYYGYNSYRNTYSEDEIINVVVYDLENAKVKSTFELTGHIFKSIGADKNGNIYVGTSDYSKSYVESQSLYVLSSTGSVLSKKALDYPINSFSGFCTDGTFYYIDEYMISSYGYDNLMGRLMKGSFKNKTITLNSIYLDFVKNIYFGDYRTPVELLNNEYLVTYQGEVYPLSQITDSSWLLALYTSRNLEMGSEYNYIYNAGVNMVIMGDSVYSLYDNNTIYVYSLSSCKKTKYYSDSNKIFNIKKCGNDLLALETDGTNFFYKKIKSSDFDKVTTTVYNMNNFSVYANRSKEDIVSKFAAAVPADYSASLYSSEGRTTPTYKEYTLSDGTKNTAVKLSNYYRWLAGLTHFGKSASSVWVDAGRGTILLSASDFSHAPSKPSDMSSDFYESAYKGTSNSSIAMNSVSGQYKLLYTIRQFMDDESYVTPGHRNTFLTRNATNIAYGIAPYYVCQTVEYTGNPNPQGTAVKDNNEAAYAWPSAGYFPSEELSTSAYWTVNLNADKLDLSNIRLNVTITDLDTGKIYKRTSSADGLYSSSFWGLYISFAPPEVSGTSYDGKRYKVVLTNLEDSNGMPASLEYTVNFFSYRNKYSVNGGSYYCDEYGRLTTKPPSTDPPSTDPPVKSDITVSYETHVQSYGWQTPVSNGAISGTQGQSKRLEGIRIKVDGNKNLGIRYMTHIQSYGWEKDWKNQGEMSGTSGEAKRLEAICIELTGKDKDKYDIYYRVHAQSYGWLGWAKNGAPAGTAAQAKRLEGIQIVVLPKGQKPDGMIGYSYIELGKAAKNGSSDGMVNYMTHVQSYGDQSYVFDGSVSGTFGEAKRLEGIKIALNTSKTGVSGGITYKTHVQSKGWLGWSSDGAFNGTSGEAKRLEAIEIKLTGNMEKNYDVYYRVHAQTYGWLGWAKNGASAGTSGLAKRLEGIQIVVLPKGSPAPSVLPGAAGTPAYISR